MSIDQMCADAIVRINNQIEHSTNEARAAIAAEVATQRARLQADEVEGAKRLAEATARYERIMLEIYGTDWKSFEK